MHSSTRFAACAFFLAIIFFATAPMALSDEKSNVQRMIATLSAEDPAFAASEKALEEAREAFLHLFSGYAKTWAETFLKRNAEVRDSDLRSFGKDDEYAKKEQAAFLKKRADMTRYMTLATRTPFTDPAFCILLKPVCRNASYYSGKNLVAETLAEYDAYMANPQKDMPGYAVRRVNGQYWATILLSGIAMPSSSSNDTYLAFVMRVNDGSFSLSPIISPVREDFYPKIKYPLRPEKYEYGPGNISIRECRMESALTVTNTDGPFTFRADAKQVYSSDGLSYTCEPKCTGFTYAWNELTQSFIMKDGVCREDDAWLPKSPFGADNALIPVVDFIRTLAAKDERVRNHEKAVDSAVSAYLDLFRGQALEVAKKDIAGWRTDRQFLLYRLVGDEAAFVAAYLKNDEPVLVYLQRVAALSKNPDARLPLLLDSLGARVTVDEKDKKQRERDRRYPGVSDLMRKNSKPAWFVSYAEHQVALLDQPVKSDRSRYNYTASGLEGGDAIIFTYDKRRFHGKDEDVLNRYILRAGSDGDFWGYSTITVGVDSRRQYSYTSYYPEFLDRPQQRILRLHGGKISFIMPDPPKETAFFTKPETDRRGRVLWSVPGESRTSRSCEMTVALEVDTSVVPFKIMAKNVQRYQDYYLCVSECDIPYAWDGEAYVEGSPECRPEGQWGVTKQERRR